MESEASEVPLAEIQGIETSLAILPALDPWSTDDTDAATGKDDNIPNEDDEDMLASKEDSTETGTDGIVITAYDDDVASTESDIAGTDATTAADAEFHATTNAAVSADATNADGTEL